ncbi:MAG: sugar kinase [Armatimonadetes bacterium]|nr:sugar kinase [Armatimonadota bacterium]
MADLIALGEPMVEFAATERGRLSQVATFHRGWGGDTSNLAVAAARLGASVGYITRLGGDEFGRSFLTLWAQEGVDASRVLVDPAAFTGVYFIALAEDGSHDFTYYRAGSAASRLRPEDIDAAYLAAARVFHTSGITQATSDSAQAAVDRAIEVARAHGVTVSYDLNIRPRLRPLAELGAVVEATLRRADIIFLSLEDAAHLYGDLPAEAVVERMLAPGPRLAVLKLGAQGCLIASAEGIRIRLPAWPVEPVDATGAGDAFDAAFLVEWLRGQPLEEAGRFANAVGALTARGLGAVGPLPRRGEVEAFMIERNRSAAKGGRKR